MISVLHGARSFNGGGHNISAKSAPLASRQATSRRWIQCVGTADNRAAGGDVPGGRRAAAGQGMLWCTDVFFPLAWVNRTVVAETVGHFPIFRSPVQGSANARADETDRPCSPLPVLSPRQTLPGALAQRAGRSGCRSCWLRPAPGITDARWV